MNCPEPEECDEAIADAPEDLSEIMGQEQGNGRWRLRQRVGTISCTWPAGTGKTMLASRLSGLLPPLNNHEALESAAIYSLIGSTSLHKQWRRRPFVPRIIARH